MGVGKSLMSSLSHIQSLQFNFYFADESQVFKIILKKLVRVQLVFLIIQMWNGFFWGVVSRDGLGLGRTGAPGYRAHRSVAMAPMFKGIRFGRHHFCSEVWEVVS